MNVLCTLSDILLIFLYILHNNRQIFLLSPSPPRPTRHRPISLHLFRFHAYPRKCSAVACNYLHKRWQRCEREQQGFGDNFQNQERMKVWRCQRRRVVQKKYLACILSRKNTGWLGLSLIHKLSEYRFRGVGKYNASVFFTVAKSFIVWLFVVRPSAYLPILHSNAFLYLWIKRTLFNQGDNPFYRDCGLNNLYITNHP